MASRLRTLAVPAAVLASLLVLSALPAPAASTPAAPSAPLLSPAWSVRLDGAVEWQRVAPLGQLLVKTSRSLQALDPERGRMLWKQPGLGGMTQDHYEEITGTSLVVMSDGLAKPRVVILDSVDGRMLFDSRAYGVAQVLSRHYLPRSRALLLFGFSEGDPATSMYLVDVDRGTMRWKNNRLLEGQGKFTRALTQFLQAATNQSGIVSDPLEVASDTFVIASTTELLAIRTATGEIAWRAPNVHDTRKTRFDADEGRAPGLLFVGSETAFTSATTTGSGASETVYSEYSARRIADGAAAWDKGVRVRGALNDVLFTDRGLLVSPRTTGKGKIVLCDYRTGEGLWGKKGKGIDIQGGVINHDWTRAGLVLTTGFDSAWRSNKGTEYYLTLVDPQSGALRFEEPLRLRGRITSTQVLPQGLLYTTTSEVNILDLTTGRPLLDGVRSDDSLVTATTGAALYAYAGREGTLHRLDLDTASLRTVSREPVRLEEDEAPLAMETEDGRITVLSSQNVVAWGADGALQFHAHHPSPRLPGLTRALLRAEQIRMGMAAAAAGMGAAAFASASTKTSPGSLDRVVTAGAATGYAQAAQQASFMSARYGEAARTRFKATTISPDFVFMMVQQARGNHGLARVSKATGRIETVIDLGRDKEPIYEVDAVSNLIFYRPAADMVSGYRF